MVEDAPHLSINHRLLDLQQLPTIKPDAKSIRLFLCNSHSLPAKDR